MDFRPKTHYWKRHAVLVKFENGKEYNKLGTEDEYFRLFVHLKYSVRENCLNCKFSNNHYSDITISDFWLYEKLSDLENDDGISLILCNTEKGENAISRIRNSFCLFPIDSEKASYNNKETVASKEMIEKYRAFINYYAENGTKSAYKKYCSSTVKHIIRNKIVRRKYRRKISK